MSNKRGLVIAEKASLMQDIQAGYRKIKNTLPFELDFLCQSGHLIEQVPPEKYMDRWGEKWNWDALPIDPDAAGGWKYQVIPATKQKAYAIRDALRSGKYDFVVHAGDPDREGEYLVRLVLDWAHNKLPVMRFWTNDTTEKSIITALKNLHNDNDARYENTAKAAYCRAKFDWLCGMNFTRAASLAMHVTARIGRVKTPTLKIVVDREKEIAAFKPETVYEIVADYVQGFKGVMCEENTPVTFQTKEEADRFVSASLGKTAKVEDVRIKKETTYAPTLYTLSSLQVDASRKYGFTPDEVMDLVQSLYNKKLLSYPRTSCPYLSSNMVSEFPQRLASASVVPELSSVIQNISSKEIQTVATMKKYINDKELDKEGHSAIVPTEEAPVWEDLTENEKKIYETVARRFAAIFLPPQIAELTRVITDNNGHKFVSNGKVVLQKGYTELYPPKEKAETLPALRQGEEVTVREFQLKDKTSVCPKRYTAGDLIEIMSNPVKFLQNADNKEIIKAVKGIGTEATRASIIKELIKNGYIEERRGRGKAPALYATPSGTAIIETFQNENFVAVDMTAEWEQKLKQVENGEESDVKLQQQIKTYVNEEINRLRAVQSSPGVFLQQKGEIIGQCPKCRGNVSAFTKGYRCEHNTGKEDRTCDFVIWKTICGKTIPETAVKALLKSGYTANPIKGFTSKQGKRFDAYLVLDKDGKVSFSFEAPAPGSQSFRCPVCGGTLTEQASTYSCTDKECGFQLWKTVCGKSLTKKEVQQLLEKKRTEKIKGFISKRGKRFDAVLVLEDGKVKFEFN